LSSAGHQGNRADGVERKLVQSGASESPSLAVAVNDARPRLVWRDPQVAAGLNAAKPRELEAGRTPEGDQTSLAGCAFDGRLLRIEEPLAGGDDVVEILLRSGTATGGVDRDQCRATREVEPSYVNIRRAFLWTLSAAR